LCSLCSPAATGASVSSLSPNRRVGFRVGDDVSEVSVETGAAEGAAVLVVIAEDAPVGDTVGRRRSGRDGGRRGGGFIGRRRGGGGGLYTGCAVGDPLP